MLPCFPQARPRSYSCESAELPTAAAALLPAPPTLNPRPWNLREPRGAANPHGGVSEGGCTAKGKREEDSGRGVHQRQLLSFFEKTSCQT
jgi:hypothetical protein